MELRKYRTEDLPQIARLFRDTIRTINTRDYTPPQVEAWSSAWEALQSRDDFFSTLYTLVAVENGQVAGYGNLDGSGYLDHLYVHKDFQGRGIATALCQALEQHARDLGCREVTVHASITARPFFEHRGYRTEEERTEQRLGVSLVNYAMQKDLTPENPGGSAPSCGASPTFPGRFRSGARPWATARWRNPARTGPSLARRRGRGSSFL